MMGTWLYEPFPAPDFTVRDVAGQEHSLGALLGKPVLISFWAMSAPPSRRALDVLSQHSDAIAKAGAVILGLAVAAPEDAAKVRASTEGLKLPVMIAGEEVAGTYNIVHRYLFDRREDLPLPTTFLVDAAGEIVKVYSGPIDGGSMIQDIARAIVPPAERLARAIPFPGAFNSPPGERSYFQYGLELSEQGFDKAALAVFERVGKRDPTAIAFYNLGTLYMKLGQPPAAKTALERALAITPDYAEASNTLGALLGQSGDVEGAIAQFRKALATKPEYPDALNNLGFALFQSGRRQEAYEQYRRALQLQPDFAEALNNVGIFYGQQRDLQRAEAFFRKAVDARPSYGDAVNNLALVLGARGDTAAAIALLQQFMKDNPRFEPAYLTLCRLFIATGQQQPAMQVLERLLQRNPTHPQGLQLLKQLQSGR